MTSEEIKQFTEQRENGTQLLHAAHLEFWLAEIAYQLAVQNEIGRELSKITERVVANAEPGSNLWYPWIP